VGAPWPDVEPAALLANRFGSRIGNDHVHALMMAALTQPTQTPQR
jgi:hypothetical protein